MSSPIPFVPGLYDYRPGERIADLIMKQGDIQAQRQARSGEILGGMVNQLGQQLGQGVKDYQQAKDQQSVGQAVSDATSQNYLPRNGLSMPSDQYLGQLGSGAVPAAPDPGSNHIQEILNNVDPKLRLSVMKGIQDFNSAQDVADERKAKIASAQASAQQASADAAATLAHGVLAHKAFDGPDGGLSWLVGAAAIAKQKGAPWAAAWDKDLSTAQAEAQQAQASGDPNQVKAAADHVRQHFQPQVQQLEMGASQGLQDKWQADGKLTIIPKDAIGVDPVTHQPVVTNASPEKPEARSIDVQMAEASKAGDTANYKRLQKVKEDAAKAGAEGRITVQLNQPGGQLTASALDQQVDNYMLTGQRPIFQRGNLGAIQTTHFMNRLAEKYPGQVPGLTSTQFKADSESLKKIQPQTDAVTAFENVAKSNAAILQETFKDLPDLGSKFLNRPWRSLKDNMGDQNMAKFNTIVTSVGNEYGRIISNPSLSGTMSDSARHEGQVLLNPSATVGQIKTALDTLAQEAGNRRKGYEGQIDAINGRMRSLIPGADAPPAPPPPPAAAAGGPKVGDKKTFPNGKVAVFDGTGWAAQ